MVFKKTIERERGVKNHLSSDPLDYPITMRAQLQTFPFTTKHAGALGSDVLAKGSERRKRASSLFTSLPSALINWAPFQFI